MTRMIQFATAVALTLTLTACGGSGNGNGVDNTMMPPANGDTMPDGDMMTDGDMMPDGDTMPGGSTMPDADMMQPGLNDGLTGSLVMVAGDENRFSTLSAAIHGDYAKNEVMLPKPDVSYVTSIFPDGSGGFHVTSVFNGEESTVHLEAGDYDAEGFGYIKTSEDEQDDRYLALWDRDWLGDQVASDYLELGYWAHSVGSDATAPESEQSNTLMHLSWVTFGSRSEPGGLPTGSTTYEGQMTAMWWDVEGSPDTSVRNRILRGGVNLEADFGAGTISGQIDDVFIPNWNADNEDGYYLGAIRIAETAIGEAQFRADWVGEDDRMDVAPNRTIAGFTGTILGDFYGPAAEEVGGVLSGSRAATDTTPGRVITGGFGAVQPTPEQ